MDIISVVQHKTGWSVDPPRFRSFVSSAKTFYPSPLVRRTRREWCEYINHVAYNNLLPGGTKYKRRSKRVVLLTSYCMRYTVMPHIGRRCKQRCGLAMQTCRPSEGWRVYVCEVPGIICGNNIIWWWSEVDREPVRPVVPLLCWESEAVAIIMVDSDAGLILRWYQD